MQNLDLKPRADLSVMIDKLNGNNAEHYPRSEDVESAELTPREMSMQRHTAINHTERSILSSTNSNRNLLAKMGALTGEVKSDSRPSPPPIAYTGPSSLRLIANAVMKENLSISASTSGRGTPVPTKNTSESGVITATRQNSLSGPSTRTNSPIPERRTPTASGWVPLTSRFSFRRHDERAAGPRHLEYDYTRAYNEYKGAAYFALGQFGYQPPRGVVKSDPPPPNTLPSMAELRTIPRFRKACEKLDAADKALEEALAAGKTWDNTPIPPEFLQLALDDALSNEVIILRSEKEDTGSRNRSSIELEGTADFMHGRDTENGSLASTKSISTIAVGANNPLPKDEGGIADNKASEENLIMLGSPLSSRSSLTSTAWISPSNLDVPVAPALSSRKRLLREVYEDDGHISNNGMSKGIGDEKEELANSGISASAKAEMKRQKALLTPAHSKVSEHDHPRLKARKVKVLRKDTSMTEARFPLTSEVSSSVARTEKLKDEPGN